MIRGENVGNTGVLRNCFRGFFMMTGHFVGCQADVGCLINNLAWYGAVSAHLFAWSEKIKYYLTPRTDPNRKKQKKANGDRKTGGERFYIRMDNKMSITLS